MSYTSFKSIEYGIIYIYEKKITWMKFDYQIMENYKVSESR